MMKTKQSVFDSYPSTVHFSNPTQVQVQLCDKAMSRLMLPREANTIFKCFNKSKYSSLTARSAKVCYMSRLGTSGNQFASPHLPRVGQRSCQSRYPGLPLHWPLPETHRAALTPDAFCRLRNARRTTCPDFMKTILKKSTGGVYFFCCCSATALCSCQSLP